MTIPRDTRIMGPADAKTQLEALLVLGNDAAIGLQESAGQVEMVNSSAIPRKLLRCTEDDLAALGFKLGEPVDDLFRVCELPDGWTREASTHAMWSYIKDGQGERRCAIFYKAAFYDRRANLRVLTDDDKALLP